MTTLKATKITVEKYTWGALLVVEAGHAVTVIAHPEAFPVIARARDEGVAGTFREETGRSWGVRPTDDGGLVFVTRNVSKVRLTAAQAASLPVAAE